MYKQGDIVKVWSLQSFRYGGFIDGTEGVVKQDQKGDSVIVAVPRKMQGGEVEIDPSYAVYAKQLELVHRPGNKIQKFQELVRMLKEM